MIKILGCILLLFWSYSAYANAISWTYHAKISNDSSDSLGLNGEELRITLIFDDNSTWQQGANGLYFPVDSYSVEISGGHSADLEKRAPAAFNSLGGGFIAEEIGSISYIDLKIDGNSTVMSGNGIRTGLVPTAGDNLLPDHLPTSHLIYSFFTYTTPSGADERYNFNHGSITIEIISENVTIDIKPYSDPNSINLSSSGVVPVAILSTEDFDATTIKPETVSLAGASVKMVGKSDKFLCHQEDIDADGLNDLVCQVYTAQFMIEEGETAAILEAETTDGVKVRGEDIIRIVPD